MQKTLASRYMDRQRQVAGNSNFRNATGPINGVGMNTGKPAGWNANGGSGLPTTKPYVLIVTNASASPVLNFDVLGANQYLSGGAGGGTWSASGNFTKDGVTISSGLPGISYQQFLQGTQSAPFKICAVYCNIISGSNSQASDIYNITSTSMAGSLTTDPIIPLVNPLQQQGQITVLNTEYNIDGLSKITWGTIYASVSFRYMMFPAVVVDPASALVGQKVQQTMGAPSGYGTLG